MGSMKIWLEQYEKHLVLPSTMWTNQKAFQLREPPRYHPEGDGPGDGDGTARQDEALFSSARERSSSAQLLSSALELNS